MFEKQKYTRSIKKVGKENYNFDFELEKGIYYYLCCVPIKKKESKKIKEELQFESYREWKNYIWNKYCDYSDEGLFEFSRYLNQCIRNIEPNHEFSNIMISIIPAISFTKLVEVLFTNKNDFIGSSKLVIFVVILIMIGALAVYMFFVVWNIITPLWKYNREENFLKDYKEIIDDMRKYTDYKESK